MQTPTTKAHDATPSTLPADTGRELVPAVGPGTELHLGLGHGYLLGKSLGQSTCGAVWQATWLQTGETVAVKTLKPGATSTDERAAHCQALLREADQLRRLRHRHIVRFQRSGDHYGEPVLVLEQMHESLHQHLQRLPRSAAAGMPPCLPLAVALRWAHQVALGLEVLHRDGQRHLDVKPANLLLTAPGLWPQRLKIADFGACLGPEVGVHPFFGTPGWVAPEQMRPVGRDAQGQPLFCTNARTDVYALGQLLFAMLTGQQTEFSRSNKLALASGAVWASSMWGPTAEQVDAGGLTEADLNLLLVSREESASAAAEWRPETLLIEDEPTWVAASTTCRDVGLPGGIATYPAKPSGSRERRIAGAKADVRLIVQQLCQPHPDKRPRSGGAAAALLAAAIAMD